MLHYFFNVLNTSCKKLIIRKACNNCKKLLKKILIILKIKQKKASSEILRLYEKKEKKWRNSNFLRIILSKFTAKIIPKLETCFKEKKTFFFIIQI